MRKIEDCINYKRYPKKSLYTTSVDIILRINNLPLVIEAESNLDEYDLAEKILSEYDFDKIMEFYKDRYISNTYVVDIKKLIIDGEIKKKDGD